MSPTSIDIKFHPSGRSVQVKSGTPLWRAIQAAGIELAMPCGGKGRCGKCKVLFEQGAADPTPTEQARLTETELLQGYRLGCQATPTVDAVVSLPEGVGGEASRILTTGVARRVSLRPAVTKRTVRVAEPSITDLRSDLARIMDAFGVDGRCARPALPMLQRLGKDLRRAKFNVTGVFSDGELIALERGDTSDRCFGAAFDIGTTTIAGYLMDLHTGYQLAVAAAMNPQVRIGDDVISRIAYTMHRPDGLRRLQQEVVRELNRMIRLLAERAGVRPREIYEATVVGNTCMGHLFLGVDPRHLAVSPYVPTVSQSVHVGAPVLKLGINPLGRIYVLPNIAGYVGADTVGIILATGLNHADRPVLAVDIGTNGEIVLGWKDRMLACSTAAGPAFEGAHIKHGMRAAPGAIDAVWFDDHGLQFGTVDGGKAQGICGSGLLDAVVCLCQAGIIQENGQIVDSDEVPAQYAHLRERLRAGRAGAEFVLARAEECGDGTPVVVTQRDVRELQLAKGAIAAGIRTLMSALSLGPDDLDSIVLAGAFGNYIRKESAMKIGLIPEVPEAKVRSVGNAAGEGAKLALISVDAREEADRIARSVRYIELTTDRGFQDRFAEALAFGPCGWM